MAIISVEKLAAQTERRDLVVVDVRWALGNPDHGLNAYRDGHIPGAVFADLEADLSGEGGPGRHPLPDPEAFDRFLGSIGATPNSTIVAYDDAHGAIASRLWWMLTDQGHRRAFVLDGGYPAWITAGEPIATSPSPRAEPQPAGIALRQWRGIATVDHVAQRPTSTVLIDARAAVRFRGDTEPIDARAGHIPGAVNLPHSGNVIDGHMADLNYLSDRFAAAGVDHASDVIVHCGSGVTACHDILAMTLAGLPRPRLFVGSWSEWASTDRPLATGGP